MECKLFDDYPPLHRACKNGDRAAAEALLDAGADVNAKDAHQNWPPLNYACSHGHMALVQLLVERGAELNLASGLNGDTALHCACANSQFMIVKYLIEKGARADSSGSDSDMDFDGTSYVSIAAMLIERGSDVDRIDVDASNPLLAEWDGEHEATAQLLRDIGTVFIQMDREGVTPLQLACHDGDLPLARLIVAKGGDVNRKGGNYGRTPLHQAGLFGGNLDVTRLLLEHGAEINATDCFGATAFYDTCRHNHFPFDADTAALLVENGADIDLGDGEDGSTPLVTTLKWTVRPEICEFLDGAARENGLTWSYV